MKTSVPLLIAANLCAAIWLHAAVDLPIEEPIDLIRSEAAAGDPGSQFKLALTFKNGKDIASALQWYRKAAQAGFSPAQYNLAVLYANGTEVPRDEREAAKWFYAAAQNGVFDAQKILVEWYVAGRGVEKSPAKALGWDMIARRTLELEHGIAADTAPKPGNVRADGAAEMRDAAGGLYWAHPDGGVETADATGVRRIKHPDGRVVTLQKDGTQETLYPNGVTEELAPSGRKTLRDGKGHVQITEPDGTRIEEGNAVGDDQVRVVDRFDKDGKRVSHRVTRGDSTYEERADGTRVVQTKYQRDDGVEVFLVEDVGADGTVAKGRLCRALDGEAPTGSEIWKIRRTLHLATGETVDVFEEYSSAGFYAQEEVPGTRKTAPVAGNTAAAAKSGQRTEQSVFMRKELFMPARTGIPVELPTGFEPKVISMPLASGSPRGIDDPAAFRPKPDIAPMISALEAIEGKSRNFAGATVADHERAKAAALAYLIPLPNPPQKPAAGAAWLREKTLTKTTLHEVPLLPIPDDRSKQVPFGFHGRDVIKRQPWRHAETAHFIVHFVEERDARLTMQYIEGVFTMVTGLLNLDAQRAPIKSHVFVFPNKAAWREYGSVIGLSESVAGFAYKTELLLPAADDKEGREASIKTLCHEVTHAIIARFYPARKLPLWMNEGLAEYIAARTIATKRSHPVDKYLRKTTDPVVDVKKLFDRIKYGEKTTQDRLAIFYGNSEKSVRAIVEKLPIEGFPKFLNALAAGNLPQPALAAAYGKKCDSIAAVAALVND